MYIFDEDLEKNLDGITILLTRSEIEQLIGYAKQLLEENPPSDHYHLSNENYQKEITICIYNPDISTYNPKVQKLIKEDEDSARVTD
ncbi:MULTISPECIES: hypothetical protein [Parachlamydia]|jgi:hypothetical protein|uniref:Uncharacterized protein n=2 Tax=Parachlamydia acanthamoebae TaxID=83552 RepID=F8KZ22_PARAV|nr:hypothetical protein [Parachlamydia acanthamoebae]KIA78123.1 hypothetical protein DB43_ET00030 [Parachlamydia acanthamoebae]CCB86145.1 putative uncharacterized protein [Parachlamydia acanthamoebae UV-7]